MTEIQEADKMADIKVQFRTTAEDRDWFKATAEASGVTQDELFSQMKDAFAASEFADEHPDHRAALEVLDAHLAAIRSQLMDQVSAFDQAREVARIQLQDRIDRAESDRASALAAAREAKAETESAKAEVASLAAERDDAVERASRAEELSEQIGRMQEAANRAADELARTRVTLDQARSDLDAARAETDRVRTMSEEMLSEAEARAAEAEARLGESVVEVASLRATADGLNARIDLLSSQLESLKATAASSEGFVQSLLAQVTSRDNRIADLEAALDLERSKAGSRDGS